MNKKTEESRIAYNKIAYEYDTSREGYYTRFHIKELSNTIVLSDGDIVLDVACGNGTLLQEFLVSVWARKPDSVTGAPSYPRYNGYIIKLLPDVVSSNIVYIEAYANKNNKTSTRLLEKGGFEIVGENKSGKSYLYRGRYSALAKRFKI